MCTGNINYVFKCHLFNFFFMFKLKQLTGNHQRQPAERRQLPRQQVLVLPWQPVQPPWQQVSQQLSGVSVQLSAAPSAPPCSSLPASSVAGDRNSGVPGTVWTMVSWTPGFSSGTCWPRHRDLKLILKWENKLVYEELITKMTWNINWLLYFL